ncbi:MAG: hypothetical protein K2G83_04585, partial [Ruminococcus sp.]|nr:hypothetical protein [Ruminococcus sp.]
LTQCLSVANAVYINDSVVALTESANLAANKTEITIDKIVTVEPGAGEGISSRGDGYIIYGADGEKITDEGSVKENAVRFEKYSEWYDMVSELILEIASGDSSSGTIDPSKLYDAVVARAGKYAETAKGVFEEIGDINYNVDIDGNITITASVGNITPVLTADGEEAMMETLKKLAEENNAPELAEEEGFFDGVVIAGDITVTLDASDIIMRGTSAVGEITFVDSQTGNVYKGSGIIDYAIERFEILDNTAKNKVAELKDKYDVDMTSVEKDIDDSLGFYIDKLKYASEKVDVVLGLQESGNFASYSEATVWLNEKIDEKLKDRNIPVINKKVPEIPPTAGELASNKKILEAYTDILNQLGQKVEGYDINITADDLAEFVDGMSNISFTVENGNAVIVGEFPDAESEESWAYLKEKYGYNEQYTYESYKEVTLTVNFDTITNAGGGLADADLQFKRILTVEYDPTITTTTSTTTTTTDTGDVITTTTTTDTDTGITTTTTTDTDTGITTTTTTDTDTGITTTTTTVTGEDDSVIRASIETEVVGYYFSHDPRPFKAENVNVAKMWTKDAEGKEVDVEFDPSLVTFEEVNSKADNPEEAYDIKNTTFKY